MEIRNEEAEANYLVATGDSGGSQGERPRELIPGGERIPGGELIPGGEHSYFSSQYRWGAPISSS